MGILWKFYKELMRERQGGSESDPSASTTEQPRVISRDTGEHHNSQNLLDAQPRKQPAKGPIIVKKFAAAVLCFFAQKLLRV
jgi:hypothetical protein